jgi:hypothetical protein
VGRNALEPLGYDPLCKLIVRFAGNVLDGKDAGAGTMTQFRDLEVTRCFIPSQCPVPHGISKQSAPHFAHCPSSNTSETHTGGQQHLTTGEANSSCSTAGKSFALQKPRSTSFFLLRQSSVSAGSPKSPRLTTFDSALHLSAPRHCHVHFVDNFRDFDIIGSRLLSFVNFRGAIKLNYISISTED